MAECQNCKNCLYNRYPRLDIWPTPHKTRVAVVGGGATTNELDKSNLFHSHGGQILKHVMQLEGLPTSGDDVYYTLAVKCHVPKNRKGLSGAIDRCRAHLIEEMEAAQPELIIALGQIALTSLTADPTMNITKCEGTIVESKLLPGVHIFVATHPARVLQMPSDYRKFVYQMRNAAYALRTGRVKEPKKQKHIVVDSMPKLMRMMRSLEQVNRTTQLVACDLETTGLEFWKGDILTTGIAIAEDRVYVLPAGWEDVIRHIVQRFPEILWIWHNGKFDWQWLRSYGIDVPVDYDTLLEHYILDENSSYNLEEVAKTVLGASVWKSKANSYIKSKEGFISAPLAVQYERVAEDAAFTYQLHMDMIEDIHKSENYTHAYEEVVLPASNLLAHMEYDGIYVNREALEALKEQFTMELEDMEQELAHLVAPVWNSLEYQRATKAKKAPESFNPRSPKQVSWLLFQKLKLVPDKFKGNSAAKEVIECLRGKSPIVDVILQIRSKTKELKTYVISVEEKMDHNDIIHAGFNLHRTATGRLSSTKPNLQNIPKLKKATRNIFQAPPGRVFVEADYKAAELRGMACLAESEVMRNIFVELRDLHNETALSVFGPDFTPAQRGQAKTLNFGIPYGRAKFSISDTFGIPLSEAAHMIEAWFVTYPKVAAYLESNAYKALHGIALVTPMGRHRRFGVISPANRASVSNEAKNFVIQSLASDLTLMTAVRIDPILRHKYHARVVNLVHDSILIDCPDVPEIIEAVARLLNDEMVRTPSLYLDTDIPFAVDVTMGQSWAYQRPIMDFGKFGYSPAKDEWVETDHLVYKEVA